VAITKRSDPAYIPSACLIYFVRASRRDNNEAWFERLYRILAERVLRSLPKAESQDGKTESLTRGIVRDKVYITNVVKHFNSVQRGKWRIHKKPNAEEIAVCRPWLDAEIAIIRPAVIVCLGASAAQARGWSLSGRGR